MGRRSLSRRGLGRPADRAAAFARQESRGAHWRSDHPRLTAANHSKRRSPSALSEPVRAGTEDVQTAGTRSPCRRDPLAPPPRLLVEPVVRAALVEDLGRAGDITTDTSSRRARRSGAIAARQEGVISGVDAAASPSGCLIRRLPQRWNGRMAAPSQRATR